VVFLARNNLQFMRVQQMEYYTLELIRDQQLPDYLSPQLESGNSVSCLTELRQLLRLQTAVQ